MIPTIKQVNKTPQSKKSTLIIYQGSPGTLLLQLLSDQDGVTLLILDLKSGNVSPASKGSNGLFYSLNLIPLAISTIMASCTSTDLIKVISRIQPGIFKAYSQGFSGGPSPRTSNHSRKSPATAQNTSTKPSSPIPSITDSMGRGSIDRPQPGDIDFDYNYELKMQSNERRYLCDHDGITDESIGIDIDNYADLED